jgi:excisionase family DNA binding protein
MADLLPEGEPGRLEPLVNVEEAAVFLGVQPGTAYLWAETGRIPSYKIGTLRRFRLSDLEAHLRAHRQGPEEPSPGGALIWPGYRSVPRGTMRRTSKRSKSDPGE